MKNSVRKLVESVLLEDEDIKRYAVVHTGGLIGSGAYVAASFDDKEAAKEKAKRLRKLLTPAEREYYRERYIVVDRDHPGAFYWLFKKDSEPTEESYNNEEKYELQVGDRVKCSDGKIGEIVHINGDTYEVKISGELHNSYYSWNELELFI